MQSAYNRVMTASRNTASNLLTLCVALRLFETEREIVILKAKENDFHAFTPYAKEPLGDVDCHMSWHASGERHAVSRIRRGHTWIKDKRTQRESAVMLSPPSMLKGVGPLFHSGIFPKEFLGLLPAGTNKGASVVLDANAAKFRNDFTVIRVYLVEPGMEAGIPIFPDTGPRILYLIKQTVPWLAVEVYQQAEMI